MGFEILPYEEGDVDKYDVFTITSNEEWTPQKFKHINYINYNIEETPEDIEETQEDSSASANPPSLIERKPSDTSDDTSVDIIPPLIRNGSDTSADTLLDNSVSPLIERQLSDDVDDDSMDPDLPSIILL